MPFHAVLKWERHDAEGMPLPDASKMKQRHDGEGACPSSPCWNGNNTRRRGIPLLVASKWQKRNEEGHTPPRRVEKIKNIP